MRTVGKHVRTVRTVRRKRIPLPPLSYLPVLTVLTLFTAVLTPVLTVLTAPATFPCVPRSPCPRAPWVGPRGTDPEPLGDARGRRRTYLGPPGYAPGPPGSITRLPRLRPPWAPRAPGSAGVSCRRHARCSASREPRRSHVIATRCIVLLRVVVPCRIASHLSRPHRHDARLRITAPQRASHHSGALQRFITSATPVRNRSAPPSHPRRKVVISPLSHHRICHPRAKTKHAPLAPPSQS